jgi:L-lysine 2,3-aminomutase
MIFIKEKKKIKYFNKIEKIDSLSEQERTQLANITDEYRFCANDYYLSLIDWDDPTDPIRKLIIFEERETEEFHGINHVL